MKQQIIIVFLVILVTGNIFGYGNGAGNGGFMMDQYIATLPYEEVSDNERMFLLQMREEEKLARDVYDYLFERWGMRVFENISSSEQTHMNAIGVILSKYNIPDPVINDVRGEFTDENIKELYIKLTTMGETSLTSALTVGATIEDLDIFDLNNAMANSDNIDILFVFGNLKKGSENHMRAFYGQLTFYNVVYKAQYISQDELDLIIATGGNGRRWGN